MPRDELTLWAGVPCNLTSGLGRNLTFIVFIPKTLEEKLQDMKKYVDSLERIA